MLTNSSFNKIYQMLCLVLISIGVGCGCNFSYVNEYAEKQNAERIAGLFYSFIENRQVNDAINCVKNEEALRKEVAFRIDEVHKDLGKYRSRTLKNWQTVRTTGSNAVTDYTLVFEVNYEGGTCIETFALKKENYKIHIVEYNVAHAIVN
jgi:hypothetical protein